MENPVDFLDKPGWRNPEEAVTLIQELSQLGFIVTAECCEIKSMDLQALGLLHKNGKHFAVLYENASEGFWMEVGIGSQRCKIKKNTFGKKTFIATNSCQKTEWGNDSKEFSFMKEGDAESLLNKASEMIGELAFEPVDPISFSITLHDFMFQKWSFTDSGRDPEIIQGKVASDEKRVSQWIEQFVRFYRKLGFFKMAEELSYSRFAKIIVEYDEALFGLCEGVETVVDDLDELIDMFDSTELKCLPETSQLLDLKFLAVLDPDRVWWSYRKWNFDKGYSEEDVVIDGSEFIQSLAEISGKLFEPDSMVEKRTAKDTSEIQFDVKGKRYCFSCQYKTSSEKLSRTAGVIAPDLSLLAEINKTIQDSGWRFVLFNFEGEKDEEEEKNYFLSQYIILLCNDDRKLLKEKRGWEIP